ncbi:hypothetical protein LARI1_G008475, partial [Lachnellula arida]
AGGVSEEGMKVLGEKEIGERQEKEKEGGGLSAKQWAVVRFADAMTRDVRVGEAVFEGLRKHFF